MASRGCVCFVGNLPGDVREREIEDLFYKVNWPILSTLLSSVSLPWNLQKYRHVGQPDNLDHTPSFWSGVMRACGLGLAAPLGKNHCKCSWTQLLGYLLQYGRIRNIDLKLPPRPPAFAFVEFENPR